MVQAIGSTGQQGGSGGAIPNESALWPPYGLTFLRWKETTLTVQPNVVSPVLAYSASRVYALVGCGTIANSMRFTTDIRTFAGGGGIGASNLVPFVLTWSTNGAAVNQAWFMRPSGAVPLDLVIQETFYEPALPELIRDFTDGPIDCSI